MNRSRPSHFPLHTYVHPHYRPVTNLCHESFQWVVSETGGLNVPWQAWCGYLAILIKLINIDINMNYKINAASTDRSIF